MGSFVKFLGATIGWGLGGPLGAILGYALGNMVDLFSSKDVDEAFSKAKGHEGQNHPGDFEVSLLVLSSLVIKADGKVDQRELDYVRAYFVQMYGKDRANAAFRLFKEIVKNKNVNTAQVCGQIRMHLNPASRLQLVHFLFGIAAADGQILESEERMIHTISNYFYISAHDYQSVKAMFFKSTDSAYVILEVSKDASDAEVKKAYRKMVKKYHPDRLVGLGEEAQKGGKQKFIEVQKAYEAIVDERKIS